MSLNNYIINLLSYNSYAKQLKNDSNYYPFEISLKYKIINTQIFSNERSKELMFKVFNLLNNIVIKPKQIFSFWKIIGNSSATYNVNDSLFEFEIFTSIIYYLSLLSGLSIIERHHYSFDNLNDAERLFPLGADAKILYNSEDLRIKNNFSFPVKLKFENTTQYIIGFLVSTQEIISNEVVFKCRNYKNYREVLTRVNGKTIEVSFYKNI